MAFLQCDPFGDFCFVGLPFSRDPWKILPRDTLTALAETPFSYLCPSGICPVPGVSRRNVSEVFNDKDKFQVLFTTFIFRLMVNLVIWKSLYFLGDSKPKRLQIQRS